MVVLMWGWDEEGSGFPEVALPCIEGVGEVAVPTVGPLLGIPVPNRELREPVSADGPRRGLVEIGEGEGCNRRNSLYTVVVVFY